MFNIIVIIKLKGRNVIMELKPIKTKSKPLLVKLSMNEDKTSYYITIPKEVRNFLDIKGGEYFSMKGEIKGEEKKIKMKMVEFAEE